MHTALRREREFAPKCAKGKRVPVPTWKTKPKSLKETLQRVYKILHAKSRWTKGALARDKDGNWNECEKSAISFCTLGACCRVNGRFRNKAIMTIQRVLRGSILVWNDDPKTTHADVMRVLKAAIQSCEDPRERRRAR